MKTKEELVQLKIECETLSNKLQELSEEELRKVTGGKSYWDGSSVKFSSEDGDWHKGDRFKWRLAGGPQWENLELIDNGVFINAYTGHRYNAKRYSLSGVYNGNTQITDYDVMMRVNDLTFIQ